MSTLPTTCVARNVLSGAGRLLLAAALVLPLSATEVRAGAAAETPEQFVARTSDDVLLILRDKGLDHDAKISRLEKMLDERSDFATIAKLVLAVHYKTFSDAQKQEFQVLLHRYLTTTYGDQIDNYGSETSTVTGGREEARGDYTVLTKIQRPNGQPELAVEYRLRKVDGAWKLIDVVGEGVSLVSNLRSQFGEILNAGGPERLLKVLREKNAAGEPRAGEGRTSKRGGRGLTPILPS